MDIREYGVLFWTIVGISALLAASPALSRLLVYPRTEFFTEFWLLDPNQRTEDYPFNVTVGGKYKVFLGIGNRLGYAAYYMTAVKFRNQTQSGADSFNRTWSSLPALYEIRAFVDDEGAWEAPLTFSFDYEYNETLSQVEVHSMMLNDILLEIPACTVAWDTERSGFFGDLFFELWIHNGTAGAFTYHERFVGLWLNMTGS